MFKKKIINISNNLKKSLHLEIKIKSNVCLDIRTKKIIYIQELLFEVQRFYGVFLK